MSINDLKIRFKTLLLLLISLMVSGCFHSKGTHYVNHYGDSDSGNYVISMNSILYFAYLADNPNGFNDLYKFSKPSITHRDSITYIFDQTGNASMEHFYNNYQCVPTNNQIGWSDCTFSMSIRDLNFPAWSFDWNVVLHREMILLNSNHHRQRVTNGISTLSWYFDGNRASKVDVQFTVRVPNS